MVLIRYIRGLVGVTGLILLTIFFSCEDEIVVGIICSDCNSEEPLEAGLDLKLDGDFGSSAINITIYEGSLEDSVVFKNFQTVSKKRTVMVPINKKYTITAQYLRNGITYLAVNSAFPRVRYDTKNCDEPCFWIYDKTVNLKLR